MHAPLFLLLIPLLLISCAMPLASSPAPASPHYDILILAGQSNMDGRGKVADLTGPLAPFAKERPDILLNYANSGTRGRKYSSHGWVPLRPGYAVQPGLNISDLPGPTFGPEITLGHLVADRIAPRRLAIIKFCEGGTSLEKQWRVGDPSGLYAAMLAHVRKAVAKLETTGGTCTIRGFFWHQGESDAGLSADAYVAILRTLIERVRADLAAPDLPVFVGEVFDNAKRDAVRAAQRRACDNIPHCTFVPATGLTTWDGGTHFDAASQIELGKRFADSIPR